jgi:hypothetical protein
MKLDDICSENEAFLLRYYNAAEKQIKTKIFLAAKKGNDRDYLIKLQSECSREIEKLENRFKYYSTVSIQNAYKSGVNKTESELKKLKIDYTPLKLDSYATFGGIHKEAVKVAAENTYQSLSKITKLIGRDVNEYLTRPNFKDTQEVLKALGQFVDSETMRKVGLEGVRGVIVGSDSWQQGVSRIEKEFAKQDIFKVPYYSKKTGELHRMVSARDYAITVAINTTAEAHRTGTENRILETFEDNDLVEIVGPDDDKNRDACSEAVGHIYSIEGRTQGYQTIAEYRADGGFGINCRHDMSITSAVNDEYDKIGADIPLDENTQKTDEAILPKKDLSPLEAALLDKENEIKDRKTEKAYILDALGNTIFSKVGNKNSVGFTSAEASLFKDNILTHNHPGSPSSFSDADIRAALRNNLKEVRAVDGVYRYSMKPGKKWIGIDTLNYKYKSALKEMKGIYTRLTKDGIISYTHANSNIQHSIWKRVSYETGLIYKREKWKD